MPSVELIVFDGRAHGLVAHNYCVPCGEAFTVGRVGEGNDIELEIADAVYLPRLLALFIPVPSRECWIIVDLGSLVGFRITHRYVQREAVPIEEELSSRKNFHPPRKNFHPHLNRDG